MKNTLKILIVSSVFMALMLGISASYPLFAHAAGCNYNNTGWYAEPGYYNIGSSFGPNGCISATGVVNEYYLLPSGFSFFTLDITPDSGYQVADVLVDGHSVGAVTTYTFPSITADLTISATFKAGSATPPGNVPGAIGSNNSDSGPILPNTQGSTTPDSGPILPNTQGSNAYEGSNIVTDTTPPVINGTSPDISATSSDSGGVVVNYTLPTANDAVDGSRRVVCTPASGSVFPIGITTVTCESKDLHSNTATTTFKVTVTLANAVTPTDLCPNIDGVQSSIPSGMIISGGNCITPSVVSSGGSYGGSSSFSSSGSFYGVSPLPISVVSPLAIATAPITSATTSCPLITSYLKLGANNDGAQVAKLQIFLKNSQHLNVDVTGIFDQKTFVAVKAFQSRYLSDVLGPWTATIPSGYVYITTSKKINEIACNSPLTLSRSDLAIINAYIINRDNAAAGIVGPAAPGAPFTPGTLNASTTTLTPEIGQNTTTGTANTASVVNASIFQRFWNFIKSLF